MRSLILLAVLALAACGNSNPSSPKDAAVPTDAGLNGPDASCFTNPTTNDEIINACTTAQKIYLNPTLPLLGSDGTVPPLP
jgi:hypothetical protein